MAVLDFSKAFDKVPHSLLIQKLKYYNLHEDTVGWITSFLSDRMQRVVIDGYSSAESPVLSGVPQGSVLGPALFLIFINDIADSLSSIVRLFADDCLVYREIKSRADQFALQQDLDKLVEWAQTWGMEFNVQKCNILTITWKKSNRLAFTYKMKGQIVEGVRSTKYLGITITEKLKWNVHIAKISGAANKMLGFMWRNLRHAPTSIKEKAYTSFIRPKLEYSSSIWDPHTQKDINQLEMVQHRAARFVLNCPHRRTDQQQPSISSKVEELGWEPLKDRRRKNRLVMLYRVVNNLVEVPSTYHPCLRDPQPVRGNQKQFIRQQPEVDAYKYSFILRTVTDWNGLDPFTVAANSLEFFKEQLC